MALTLSDCLWWLRHPSARRCPKCRLNWEPKEHMATMDGVCHDCYFEAMT